MNEMDEERIIHASGDGGRKWEDDELLAKTRVFKLQKKIYKFTHKFIHKLN